MAKKPTRTSVIGENPLDNLISPINGQSVDTASETAKKQISQKQESLPERSRIKERMTVQIDQSVIQRVKDVVYWERLTVAQFTEEALETALKRLEKLKGEPYPKRKAELKPGRPIK
jgi:hypothetical protein